MAKLLSDITVRQFMAALFNGQYEDVEGEQNFDLLFTAYVDLSGIGQTEEYRLLSIIHNLQWRIGQVSGFIQLEKDFFLVFSEPFMPAFDDLKRFGHRLSWDPQAPSLFIKQLERAETMEKTRVAELDEAMKELLKIKKEGIKPTTNSRQIFVQMLNGLRRNNYQVDKDKTDMEELSLMIREHDEELRARAEEAERLKSKNGDL